MAARPSGVSMFVYSETISIEKMRVLLGTVRFFILLTKS